MENNNGIKGGWANVNKLDFTDGVVGTIGLGFSYFVYIGLITNPVTISAVGIGLVGYGIFSLGVNSYNYFSKP